MKHRFLASILIVVLFMMLVPVQAFAGEAITYKISAPKDTVSQGDEFDITVSLTDYDKSAENIRAIQIDITNIDSDLFEIVSHESLIVDQFAASNKTTYSSTEQYVRYTYLNMSGTLDKATSNIMKLRLKLNPSIAQSGIVSLPVSIKIGTNSSNLTYNDTISISYANTKEQIGFSVSASKSNPAIGDEFELSFKMLNYSESSDSIRALQIDIANIDTQKIIVLSHETSVSDQIAASNKTQYNNDENYIRYTYLNLSGTMSHNTEKIFKIRLKINSDLTEGGQVVLPITYKIGTTKENITINSSFTVNYVDSSDIISVDVTWGCMEFVYDDGTWNADTHEWLDSGWKPVNENANVIIVKNNGSSDVKASFSYKSESGYESISGIFCDSAKSVVTNPITIIKDAQQTYYLNLIGITQERKTDSFIKIGTVTLTLSE